MKKEEVYLDLTKLTKEQLINVAECVKDEMYSTTYADLSYGIIDRFIYLYFSIYEKKWARCVSLSNKKTEITYFEFLGNFCKQKVESITLPIEDYNRLRKLELKQEIKRKTKKYI